MSANIEAYRDLMASLPAEATLIAVSKFQANEAIDSLYAAGQPTRTDRTVAAATALGWDGAGIVADRIARPLGLALSAIHLLASLSTGANPQPPATRADDIVLCRPVILLTADRTMYSPLTRSQAWRIGVLRDDQLILDMISSTDSPCVGPAGHERPAEPSRD